MRGFRGSNTLAAGFCPLRKVIVRDMSGHGFPVAIAMTAPAPGGAGGVGVTEKRVYGYLLVKARAGRGLLEESYTIERGMEHRRTSTPIRRPGTVERLKDCRPDTIHCLAVESLVER